MSFFSTRRAKKISKRQLTLPFDAEDIARPARSTSGAPLTPDEQRAPRDPFDLPDDYPLPWER